MSDGILKNFRLVLSSAILLCLPAISSVVSAAEDTSHLYLKGLLLERYGKLEDAFKNYDQVARQDPNDVFIHETLASVSMRLGQMSRALDEGQKVVSLKPEEPHSYLILGRVRLSRGEIDEADKAFNKALDLEPNDNEALLYSAHLHSTDNPKQAISLYEKFIQNNPHSVEGMSRIAELQERLGNSQAAEEWWQKIIDEEPDNVAAILSLSHLYEVRQDTAAALGGYEQARDLDPGNPGLLLRLGELYFRADRIEDARRCFESAERLMPQDLTVQFWNALIAEERKDWPAAVGHLSKVAKKSRDPGVLLRLAYYQSQNGHPRQALRTLLRLHKLDPNNPDFLYYLAMGYEDLNKYAMAIHWLEKVVAMDPQRADAQFRLGVAWDDVKKFEKAEPYLRRALDLSPQNSVMLNYLGYTYAEHGVHLDEALDMVQRALVIDPNNGAFLDSLGWVYFKMGKLEDAREAMSKSVIRVDDATVWLHYGDVLSKLGKTDDAVESWQQGLLLDPKNPELLSRFKGKDIAATSTGFSRTWLKRTEGNLRQIKSLAGQVTLEGRGGMQTFQLSGLFYYMQPQLFRFEFLGPMFIPQALLVKNSSGLHWSPPEWQQSAGADQERWLKLFGDFLSGDILKPFEVPGVKVKTAGNKLIYTGQAGELEVDTEHGVISRLVWHDDKNSSQSLDFRFQDYREVDGLWLPAKTLCRAPKVTISFTLDLSRTRVNQALDAKLFNVTAVPVSDEKSSAH